MTEITKDEQIHIQNTESGRPVIKLENLRKIYGSGASEIQALKGVSLDIFPGEILTVMGSSGSGKSTMLNIMGTMDIQTSGKIWLDGNDVSNYPESKLSEFRRFIIGFVFQNFYLLPNLDVISNVLAPLIPYGIKEKDKKRAMEILEKMGLKGREHSTVRKLSGGQSQRVAIARALINNPKVILADEPTGNLDSETGKQIVDLLINLSHQGKTIIIVTHDPRIGQMIKEEKNGRNIWLSDGQLSDRPSYDVFCYDVN